MTDDAITFDPDLITEITDRLMERIAERREHDLRGAWRAGYDYVHVYRRPAPALGRPPLAAGTMLSDPDARVPSNDPPEADRYRDYKFSYDLTSVPDDVIRRAIRGDLPSVEWDV